MPKFRVRGHVNVIFEKVVEARNIDAARVIASRTTTTDDIIEQGIADGSPNIEGVNYEY